MFSIMFYSIAFYIIFPIFFISFFKLLPNYIRYRNSSYKDRSKNRFFETITDKGNYGEFLTYTYLEQLDINKRVMTNLYLPKQDGTTTEIDLIMIAETGIYVLESKNYSGWIYGDERYKNWTQTLKNNKKNHFYNPVWQNKGHISALMTTLGIHDTKIYKSIIVFSERCELKRINITTPNIKVIKRNSLIKIIKEDQDNSLKVLSIEDIEKVYLNLQEFTYMDEMTKESHISNLRSKDKDK